MPNDLVERLILQYVGLRLTDHPCAEVVMLALEGPLGSRARVGLVSKAKGGILNVDVVRMPVRDESQETSFTHCALMSCHI